MVHKTVHIRRRKLTRNYVQKRGNKFIYRRRVPKEAAHLDPRSEVKIALKTDNYQEALIRSAIHNQQIENFWADLIYSKNTPDFNKSYKDAVLLARAHGFAYKTIDQISVSNLSEIVQRLSVDVSSEQKAEAILGGAGNNKIQLSDCTELYLNLVHDRLFNKSEHQIRKWKNPRKAAMKNFIHVVGNKHIQDVTRSDVLDFRSWWNDKLKKGFSSISANKQMRFIRDMMQLVAINNEIDIDYDPLFVKVNFRLNNKSRPPFEASFVQNILIPNLHIFNDRDCCVIMIIADTGARLSEIFGLLPTDIYLDDDIPFISIRPRQGYELKTKSSERKIPLVGSALLAFKKFPNGFEHTGNPDSFSGNVNKRLTKHNLRPTPQHSIYSLRHTFKDRLIDIEAPEEIIDDLMGHKKSGPKYGRGHKLETKHKWLKKIAYDIQSSQC